ncbi:MAG: 2-oxo acid dehydrogenase subunit E2 [Oscillospiraceae bacterium]|nr:2-oxo acid dehydrogenase subunit E2 [Oscillospiraceae bacterium]
MAVAVIMPRQGQSVESCIITKWHKNVGDTVNVDDLLFSYETDKATFDELSKTNGVLLAILYGEGDEVECLANVCFIGEAGEDISAFSGQSSQGVEAGEAKVPAPDAMRDEAPKAEAFTTVAPDAEALSTAAPLTESSVHEVSEAESPSKGAPSKDSPAHLPSHEIRGHSKASPRARAFAERSGVALEYTVASGPGGRIIERDVQSQIDKGLRLTPAAKAGGTPYAGHHGLGMGGRIRHGDLEAFESTGVAAADVQSGAAQIDADWQIVPLSSVRRTIARTMLKSLTNSAQLTLNSSFDATDIIGFRKKAKAVAGNSWLSAVTVTDIIVYSVSRTIIKHRSLNAHFLDDNTMKVFNDAHIGVAVDTPRGLLVPTIFRANTMSLSGISSRAKELYSMCAQGAISPDLIQGASFTISNMGTLGIESFTPVLNPPQTGILGVCSIIERIRGGTPYPAMGLSLTFDHRAMDGADAARFLKELITLLENFSLLATNSVF